MPDTSKKTLSGAICEVLGISDARQNDWRVERQHTCAWQPSRRRINPAALSTHYCLHRVRYHGGRLPNLPRARSRFFMPFHIELNEVDLALHMARRFTKMQIPVGFYHDWLGVTDDEARHL
ncbi:DUF455 family protein [Alphaproteobacteria bacterium]|nr:DUF455 family protein [Alphaproteobacteria bacterium]